MSDTLSSHDREAKRLADEDPSWKESDTELSDEELRKLTERTPEVETVTIFEHENLDEKLSSI